MTTDMKCRKIEDVCGCRSEYLTSEKIYLVDLKGATGAGLIKAYNVEPEYDNVLLENQSQKCIEFVAFEGNALKIKKGLFAKQCECALSPDPSESGSWLLFVEMKYANNEFNIHRDEWHKKAVNQIRSTADFLKSKGAVSDDKKLNAIIAFPKISSFSSWLTDYVRNELKPYNIIARCTNKATIVDDKVIVLA